MTWHDMTNAAAIPCRRLLLLTVIVLLAASCQPTTERDEREAANGAKPREIMIFTSGGFTAAYNILGPKFQQATGIQLQTSYGASMGGSPDSIPSRLERGEPADMIILARSSLDNLTETGHVRADSRTDLVRSSIGMAVRVGAILPDITTAEAFVQALIDADSIGYSASASGTYLSTVLFPKIGIWEQIKTKSRRIESERVATVVARGEVEIGFQQISEILPIEGISYAGPIPSEYQKVTTFSTGITTSAQNPQDARLLIEFLSSPEVSATIASTGLEPVVLDRER